MTGYLERCDNQFATARKQMLKRAGSILAGVPVAAVAIVYGGGLIADEVYGENAAMESLSEQGYSDIRQTAIEYRGPSGLALKGCSIGDEVRRSIAATSPKGPKGKITKNIVVCTGLFNAGNPTISLQPKKV